MNYRIGVKVDYFERLWPRMEEPATEELYELTEKAFLTTTGQKQRLVLDHLTRQMVQMDCLPEFIKLLGSIDSKEPGEELKNVWERRAKDLRSREPKLPKLPSGISGKTAAVLVILSLLVALVSLFCLPVTNLINAYAGSAVYVVALILVFVAFFAGGFSGAIGVAIVCGLIAGGYHAVVGLLPQIVRAWIPVGAVVFICLCVIIAALVKRRKGKKASRIYEEYRRKADAYRAEVTDACAYLDRLEKGISAYADELKDSGAAPKKDKDGDSANKDDVSNKADDKMKEEDADPEYIKLAAMSLFYSFYRIQFEHIRDRKSA